MKCTSLSVLLMAGACVASAGSFKLAETANLELTCQGEAFIVGDAIADDEAFAKADGFTVAPLPDGKAVNAYRNTNDVLDYRREAALRGDSCELTVRWRVYPYKGVGATAYRFRIPAALLDGYAYRAVTDRPYRQKTCEGTLTPAMPDGSIVSSMAYLTLKKEARAFTLDFAPNGRGLYYNLRNYGIVGNAWQLSKEGDWLVFSVGLSDYWHGGIVTTKVVIWDKDIAYDAVHPAPDSLHYTLQPKTTVALAAYEPLPEGFARLGIDPPGDGDAAGWESPEKLKWAPGVLGRMVTGRAGVLRVNPPPGQHVVTIRFGAEQAVGPFAVKANDRPVADAMRSLPGEVESFSFPLEVADEPVRLAFESEGRFGLSAVIFQRLLTPYEMRYALADDIWLAAGVPTPDKEIDPGVPALAETNEMPSTEAWRWNMAMTCFGASNTSSRNEIVTYADIERRMREVVEAGYNTIIRNGLHFRLCYLDKMSMNQRNMTRVCEVAHRYGVRVIEHHDVPLMQAQGRGFRLFLEHLDWVERDIVTGKVCTDFCVNNPEFQRWYYAWFRSYAQATGIDGCMLDEVSFHGPEYCGCKHCRQAFTRDTGYTLPYRDDEGVFFNKDNALWVGWEKQRVRMSTDFFKGIRAIFDDLKPEATLMTYTTHYGFTSQYGSRNFGGDIVDRARYADFLGTEIMSRNVFESYRAVYSLRKTKGALGLHFNAPIFGLVYHMNDPNVAYFGWALLHMNRQAGWITSIEGFDLGRFVNWKDRMPPRNAVPLSEVGVVFSRTCCNYNRSVSHAASALGCSQQLTEAHIEHDVFLDLDLEPQALARYRAIILGGVECLSDEAIAAITQFVEDGGSVIVLRVSSQSDENGIKRPQLGLGPLLGVRLEGKWIKGPLHVAEKTGTVPSRSGTRSLGTVPVFSVDGSAPRAIAGDDVDVLAWLVDEAGARLAPGVTRRAVGKGQAFYVAPPLGEANYMREYTVKDEYAFVPNPRARDLFLDIVRRAAGGPFTFEAVGIPDQVLVSAYTIPSGYAVHFLNATGVQLEPGDIIRAGTREDAFPPVTGDLVFDLRVPSVSGGRVVSPDYEGARELSIEKTSEGYRIAVPRDALDAYAVVYLDR